MNRSSNYIIVFSKQVGDFSFLGFSIMDQPVAKQYMKAVVALSEDGCQYNIGNEIDDMTYSTDDFVKMKISQSEINVMQKLFDIDDEEFESIGIFPDAITDAYDNGVLEKDIED